MPKFVVLSSLVCIFCISSCLQTVLGPLKLQAMRNSIHMRTVTLRGGRPDFVTVRKTNRSRSSGHHSANNQSIVNHISEDRNGSIRLVFSIRYGLNNGYLVVCGPSTEFGGDDAQKAPKMERRPSDMWELVIDVPLNLSAIIYHYVVVSSSVRLEYLLNRRILCLKGLPGGAKVEVRDMFHSPQAFALAASCFSRAIFGKGMQPSNAATENKILSGTEIPWSIGEEKDVTFRFCCFAPRIEAGHKIFISVSALQRAGMTSPLSMVRCNGTRTYIGEAVVPRAKCPFEYSYVVCDSKGNVICREKDITRAASLKGVDDTTKYLVCEDIFSYPTRTYKAAGVVIPVASIKTEESSGIGEFLDLKKVVDWCVKTGLQIIQVLPVNDSGDNPSPYSAASSFALHPNYVRPAAVCEYYRTKFNLDISGVCGWAQILVHNLNANWRIDHPKVLEEKRLIMDRLYDVVGRDRVLSDPDLQAWLVSADSWIKTYAAFKAQMKKEQNTNNMWCDATTWKKRVTDVPALIDPHSPDYGIVVRTYFMQYHLHLQLLEASKYAEEHGVALKGDIPIGVTRCSSDVWAEPHLFKLDYNAGAPGSPEQNWGFPPYDWEAMHEDGCMWWRRRLAHLEQYFHAFRIDHVLGFFRIWEIPKSGGRGRYEPDQGIAENGRRNLATIQTASQMLVCGEDLGDVPPEVPPALNELGVLGLRIQRWNRGRTSDYPYLCVAASSTHDCSPCRLWWNEEWGSAEAWYHQFIGPGHAPGGPPDWISKRIIRMHFESSALLTINPIMDYIDMWGSLRSQNPWNDVINRPGRTEGVWVWRMHLFMEEFIKRDDFNAFIARNLRETGRGIAY